MKHVPANWVFTCLLLFLHYYRWGCQAPRYFLVIYGRTLKIGFFSSYCSVFSVGVSLHCSGWPQTYNCHGSVASVARITGVHHHADSGTF